MKIIWFIYDAGDARVRKRVMAFRDRGWECLGFSFSRREGLGRHGIFWPDVHLGVTSGGNYFARCMKFVPAIYRVWRHRRVLTGGFVCYAFNIDNLLLAIFARMLANGNGYLVYECADIQPVFTRESIVGALYRAIEKWGMTRTDLLVTTSPMFVERYFSAVQKYRGRLFILENKVYPSKGLAAPRRHRISADVWVIGYFGSFRCRRSLELIGECGKRLKGRVKFILAGFPNHECGPYLEKCISSAEGSVEYQGSFAYPSDLPRLYGRVDFCWGFDWSSTGGNSAWLLPNRLYESGYFGVPILANETSYLGQIITKEQWGWVFKEPILESLQLWLQGISEDELTPVKHRLEQCRTTRFAGEKDYDALSTQLADGIAAMRGADV